MVSCGVLSAASDFPRFLLRTHRYALWAIIVTSDPDTMRELCGNHTLQPLPTFPPSAPASPQLPGFSLTFHPFPSFPPSLHLMTFYGSLYIGTHRYALRARVVVSAPNVMRELCGNHTLQPPPNFPPSPQLPSLSPTSQPFPSFPCFSKLPTICPTLG